MKHYQIDKVSTKNWLNELETSQIIELIASSFKGVDSQAYFQRYFNNPAFYQRCVRLFYQQDQLVGYCLLTFRKNTDNSIVMGASAAFLASYRGNNNTFAFSFLWALKTWLSHINHNLYYLDTMLSPAMYRAMGKKVAFIYPNPAMTETEIQLYQALVPDAEPSPWQNLACLKTVGRSTNYSDDEVQSLKASSKAEIAFYCQLNPRFSEGSALLVLIPVNLKQIVFTGWKWLKSLVHRN
jgi:hypothetical protein